jgi:uncharacterized membrane protein YbaN (DUF454 family)
MTNAPHLRHSLAIRWLLLIVGWISLLLGLIGILLPVMPTTPFLLLTAACFLRSSPRFYHWLINHRWLGPYLRLYLDGKGIPRRAKIGIISILWLTMTTTALLIVPWRWLSLTLLLIALAVSLYIIRLPEPVVVRISTDQ